MKGDPAVLSALNACLKWERALAGCYGGYHEYFERWHFHRLAAWFVRRACLAMERVDALEDRILALGGSPDQSAYDFDVEPLDEADDIVEVWRYFAGDDGTLPSAAAAYEDGRDVAKGARDSVSSRLMGRHKAAIEDDLVRIEAKLKRIALVGPELYLALHMHFHDEGMTTRGQSHRGDRPDGAPDQ